MTNPRAETIAQGIESTKPLVARFVNGFNDETALAQPPGLPNHVIWCLGHLAATMYRAAEKIDGRPVPTSIFGDGPGLFKFEAVTMGSTPTNDSGAYPSLARAIEVFSAACDHLASLVRTCDDAKLDSTTKWGVAEPTLGLLAMRMMFHNGMHTGQIADTRRALKMKSAFA